MKLRSCLAGICTLAVSTAPVWAVCQVPQPRLVCAEASHSAAVIEARLDSKQIDGHNSDLFVYRLRLLKLLRGESPGTIVVHEYNDSGRAPFEWNVGEEYLLFLEWYPQEHAWMLDGCGNSNTLAHAKPALEALTKMEDSLRKPLIDGMVSTTSWTTGVPGVSIRLSGTGGVFHARTDAAGHFQLRVPAGHYVATATKHGATFAANPFSYEDPTNLDLSDKTCAQVEFSTKDWATIRDPARTQGLKPGHSPGSDETAEAVP